MVKLSTIKNMKTATLILILTLIFAATISAQNTDKMPERKAPNAEEIAKMRTDKMNENLGLDEEQYEQIYKLNLKEAKSMNKQNSEGVGNRPPMRGGAGGRMGGGGNRPQMSGGMPPKGDMNMSGDRPQMRDNQKPNKKSNAEIYKEQEEAIKKYNKKLEKILNPKQMNRWNEMEKKRQNDEFNMLINQAT